MSVATNITTAVQGRSLPRVAPYVVGLAIASIFPALIWTGMLAGAGYLVGSPFAFETLVYSAVTITVFMALICAPLVRSRS